METVQFRLFGPDDDVSQLTALLHKAFASLGAMGLRYTAVDQTDEVTRRRIAPGGCYVALLSANLVGTVNYKPAGSTRGSPWLNRHDIASLGQLAVDPAHQHLGLGGKLIDMAEARARADGAREIALDTAEPATHLVNWYAARGYRFIEYAQWPGKNYRSVIMSKPLRSQDVG